MSDTGTLEALLREAGAGVIYTDALDVLPYQRDVSVAPPGSAAAVVRPQNTAGVARVLEMASRKGIPVYARGGGTMYAGGMNPHEGGIVIDLSSLDEIVRVDRERGLVVAQPGVRFGALLKRLAKDGLTVGIVPVTGPSATIGGAASAHALGTGSPKFQSFADEVAGLEAVLADGTVVRTGSAAAPNAGYFHRNCIGPDLTGLFLGGDATLGVITELALWTHPLPEHRETLCLGFENTEAAARCVAAVQNDDMTGHLWYAAGYEAATIAGRMSAVYPDRDPAGFPKFCVALELGGREAAVVADRDAIVARAIEQGGAVFPEFDEVYFRKLRFDESFWYSFAGYFSRSRCGILMSSLPTMRIPAFIETVGEYRSKHPDYLWAGAVVFCRRGAHGGVIAFYDEATQWDGMRETLRGCTADLVDIGCVPYKTGKIWADQIVRFDAYHGLLRRIKSELDPTGILSPGNLGLDRRNVR